MAAPQDDNEFAGEKGVNLAMQSTAESVRKGMARMMTKEGADGIGGPTYNPDTHFLQPKLPGYRQLDAEDARVIGDIKMHEQKIEQLLERLHHMPGVDQRWLAIGRTDIQKGFMAVVRSVAKPS